MNVNKILLRNSSSRLSDLKIEENQDEIDGINKIFHSKTKSQMHLKNMFQIYSPTSQNTRIELGFLKNKGEL